MTMFHWTSESIVAAVAVVITAAGSVFTTSYHWGQINTQVADLQAKNAATESHVGKHDDQLDSIKQQNAAMQQSLNDIKDVVHDIQTQVHR